MLRSSSCDRPLIFVPGSPLPSCPPRQVRRCAADMDARDVRRAQVVHRYARHTHAARWAGAQAHPRGRAAGQQGGTAGQTSGERARGHDLSLSLVVRTIFSFLSREEAPAPQLGSSTRDCPTLPCVTLQGIVPRSLVNTTRQLSVLTPRARALDSSSFALPDFVPGLSHVMPSELRQALISYVPGLPHICGRRRRGLHARLRSLLERGFHSRKHGRRAHCPWPREDNTAAGGTGGGGTGGRTGPLGESCLRNLIALLYIEVDRGSGRTRPPRGRPRRGMGE